MKFTDRTIRALKPRAERYEVWENNAGGFGLRVSPLGRKSWIYLYRFDGRARRMTLGAYPEVTLADAHEAHAHARKQLAQGIDPGKLEQAAKREALLSPTVRQLAQEYMDKWAKPRKRTWKEDERILAKDVLPHWGHRKARDIRRRDVVTLLDAIVDRGAPIAANHVLAVVRKMFNFAISRDIVETNPCVMVTRPAKETPRDRVLTQSEIKAFWEGLEHANMTQFLRLALKLQLVTVQRKGEIINAEWSEIDLANYMWTIPAAKSKNGLAHRVPLSPIAMSLLRELKSLTGDCRWLFPSPHGDKPVIAMAVDHAVRRNREAFGIDHFTPHDLRRTGASHMTSAEIPRLVVSKILNHVERGITAVYDRHSYDKEKRQALNRWGAQLENIIAGKAGEVIPFQRNA